MAGALLLMVIGWIFVFQISASSELLVRKKTSINVSDELSHWWHRVSESRWDY